MGETGENFESRTAAFIERERLLDDGAAAVVGVSGGADSVALAGALHAMGRYRLHLVHVHHGLRGADADGDAEFVAELASQWGLAFLLRRIDTPALAEQWGVGAEEAARRARYEVFLSAAGEFNADAVAVAHHADDQIETVLHRIVRGTHLRGLTGMAADRPLGEGVRLVRPLLWARRAEIESYCRDVGLAWRTDHTNLQNEFTRNFIRNELLPLLREHMNPKADEALLRLSAAATQAEDTLESLARGLFERACRKQSPRSVILRLTPMKKAPVGLASMVFRLALAAVGAPERELSRERYDDLLGLLAGAATAADLPGGVRAERRGQTICITRTGAADVSSD